MRLFSRSKQPRRFFGLFSKAPASRLRFWLQIRPSGIRRWGCSVERSKSINITQRPCSFQVIFPGMGSLWSTPKLWIFRSDISARWIIWWRSSACWRARVLPAKPIHISWTISTMQSGRVAIFKWKNVHQLLKERRAMKMSRRAPRSLGGGWYSTGIVRNRYHCLTSVEILD